MKNQESSSQANTMTITSSSSHTPGPWEFSVCDDDTLIVHTAGDIICEGQANKRGNDNPANFSLIAAAPDMLAALEAVARDHLDVVLAKQVRAAIARATGAAP